MESNLCKKVPNSIYLTDIYKGNSSILIREWLYINKILAIVVISKKPEIAIDINEIFLKSSGFCKIGGRKYKWLNPLNANKLLRPVPKVTVKPLPNSGKIFLKS